MQNSEREEFAALVTDVLAYYRQNATPFVLTVWWNACLTYDFEQVNKALSAHAADPERGQFAPKVADVVRILSGTYTDRAQLAWGKVLMATSAVGSYQDIIFDDPAIHAAIADCGGWPKVCRTELKELSYMQHRFCESHKAYTGRGKFDYPRRLGGDRSPDAEYQRRGIPLPAPAVIGDQALAMIVYHGGGDGVTRLSFQAIDVLTLPLQS